ncbi:MAG: glycosyltransferase family 39 protein [Bacteroidetes bacterium]|nr:glycosyltransferase family 39 protein [Bacteroidota bacterium]
MQAKNLNRDLVFIAALVLAHTIGFLLACRFTRIYMGDSFEYVYEALNIKQHFFFYSGAPAMPITEEYMTQRQPGYPFFLLLVYYFSVNNWIVLVLQNVLSIFNIYLTRKLLLRLGYDRKYDWLLLLFVLTYPAQIIYANTIAPDILLQTFTLLYVYYFARLVKETRGKYAVYMSVALVAGLFVKPVLYPFAVLHLVILLGFGFSRKNLLKQVVIAALMPLCAVWLYNAWNYERTGKFHFSSNQAFNAIFYYASFVGDKYGTDSSSRFLHAERAKIAAMPLYKDRYDYANARGMALLKANFVPYTKYHLKHSLRYLIEPGKGEIDLFTGKLTYGSLYSGKGEGFYNTWKKKGIAGMPTYFKDNPSMLVVCVVLLFNLLRLAGLVFFMLSKRVAANIRLFLLLLICYFAITTGPIANTRYFLPISLLVAGCAVMSWQFRVEKRLETEATNGVNKKI